MKYKISILKKFLKQKIKQSNQKNKDQSIFF